MYRTQDLARTNVMCFHTAIMRKALSLRSPKHSVARTCNSPSCLTLTLVQGTRPSIKRLYMFWTLVWPCLTLILVQDTRPGRNKLHLFSCSYCNLRVTHRTCSTKVFFSGLNTRHNTAKIIKFTLSPTIANTFSQYTSPQHKLITPYTSPQLKQTIF